VEDHTQLGKTTRRGGSSGRNGGPFTVEKDCPRINHAAKSRTHEESRKTDKQNRTVTKSFLFRTTSKCHTVSIIISTGRVMAMYHAMHTAYMASVVGPRADTRLTIIRGDVCSAAYNMGDHYSGSI